MARRTYRYFSGPVLYPFGFGLSYAHIQYSDVQLKSSTIAAGKPLLVTAKLHNASTTSVSEVAEVYLVPSQSSLDGFVGAPRLALVATKRVRLNPKETRTLTFTMNGEQLSSVSSLGDRAVRHGTYRIFIGGSQPSSSQLTDPLAGSTFKIVGDQPIALSR
jgi:beta-glucosidase